MIRLTTIGQVSVHIGDKPVPATNELVIAAILYLVAERGKPIPRRTFAEMFFQNGDPETVAHSARQLIYRLGKMGIPISRDPATVTLREQEAQWDLELLLARGVATDAELRDLVGGYLSNFSSHPSGGFSRWLDEHRDDAVGRLRTLLVSQIQATRSRKEFRALSRIAKACLALDPLNEEATLAAAESLVTAGSKVDALQLLDQYLEDVGVRSPNLRIAPRMLRERISGYVHEPEHEQIALVGRSNELEILLSQIEASSAIGSQACFISGPGGIGKTRLVDEACSIATLSGHAVIHVRLNSQDQDRPFAILRDLGPTLLDLPGAIGASPEALAAVRGLCGRGPAQYSRRPANAYDSRAIAADIQRKVADLVDAVTEEQPLVIRIEDADRLDEASLELIEQLLDEGQRICILMASRASIVLQEHFAASAAATRIVLPALCTADAVAVLHHLFEQSGRSVNETFVDNAARISAGIPLFLHVLFRNFLVTNDPTALPATLAASLTARVDQLQEPAKSIFDTVVTLSTLSTVNRIEEITELPRYSLMQALRTLEEQGFVRFGDGAVLPSHELLADACRRRIPATVKSLLHRAIASTLGRENSAGLDPLSIAFHWEACNENSRAVEVLVRSACASTALGQPRQAITLLQRGAALSSTALEQTAMDTALLEACHAAGEDRMGVTVAERLGAFLGRGSVECQLMAMEMGAQAGRAVLPYRSCLSRIAADQSNSPSHRARATRLLVMIAEDLGNAAAAEQALSSIADLKDSSSETIVPRLISETVFGSTERALELASQLCAAIPDSAAVGAKLQALWTASVALARCGELSRSREIVIMAYGLAKQNMVWSACAALSTAMGQIARDEGYPSLAAEWLEKTREMLSKPGGGDRAYPYYGLGIALALDRNDPYGALALLDEAERQFPEVLHQRLALSFLAHRIAINLQLGIGPSDQEYADLIQGHRERRTFGYHDFIANVVVAVLRHSGRLEDAKLFRDEYRDLHRKERSPISPAFSHLVD